MINIFQFLKQGTSLNRHAHNSNQQLQTNIIAKDRHQNHTFEETGKFHELDSQQEPQPDTNDEKELQVFKLKKVQRLHQFTKKHGIKVSGLDCPFALSNFTKIIRNYALKQEITKGLGDLGYQYPTPVQMQTIPCLLEKRNIIVTAPTGTGKTLAFLLPILNNLSVSKKITAVIMVPLQQLATQILEALAKLAIGSKIKFQCCSRLTEEQKDKIEKGKSPGYNILIATPLTFIRLFSERKVLLKHVEYIVLDQCDKCFEESFLEQIKAFLDLFTTYHPTYALFSATIQNSVEQILKTYLHDCIRIQVGGKNKVLEKISQSIQYCTNELGKLIYLKNLMSQGKLTPPVLIFVQEKQRVKQLFYEMKKYFKREMQEGNRIEMLSSQKSKEDRQKILSNFDAGKYWILITTDMVARGIDFRNVNVVINYDFPNSMLTYIHRVGRTGRAQRGGTALTFFTDEDKPLVRSLANLLKISGCEVPEWICEMPKAKRQVRKKLQTFPVRRLPVGKTDGKDQQWEQEIEHLEHRWQRIKNHEQSNAKKQKQKNDEEGWVTVLPTVQNDM